MTAGGYVPVNVAGNRAQHIVAFARRHHDSVAIAVAGRLFASLGLAPGVLPAGEAPWGDTELDVGSLLPDGSLHNVLTGETLTLRAGRVRLAECFARFPAALLHYAPPG
jgi:(1->4)-alpha-D-glucan 1-alpha-D-glucosylmutase